MCLQLLVSGHLLNFLSSLDFSASEHMREKRLVTFRMAPKRSRRQRSEKEATIADGWKKSKLSESAISSLVGRRLLCPRSVVQWFSAEGHDRPYERVSETVLFKSFVERGLGILVCDFLRGLLFFLGDPASSYDSDFHPPYFHFCSFVRGFSWNLPVL